MSLVRDRASRGYQRLLILVKQTQCGALAATAGTAARPIVKLRGIASGVLM